MASKNIKIGDICTYSYDTKNKSLSIVEVVKELSDEVVEVKFHQVIVDDSGNDYFTYLLKSGYTMNVSRKYLHRIELIAKQQAEIERLKAEHEKTTAIKEFADRIVEYIDVGHLRPATEICFSELDVQHIVEKISKEMVGRQ